MKWNETKFRIFYILELRRLSNVVNPITSFELSHLTGVNLDSLESLLPKWTRWRYLSRTELHGKDKYYFPPDGTIKGANFGYGKLRVKGRKFLSWFSNNFPELANQYLDDLAQYQDSIGLQ